MSETAGTAVRMGVFGVGRDGRHALETFVVEGGLAVAGAFDADRSRCDRLPTWIRRFPTADSLLASMDVDAVVISDEAATADGVCAVLSAGKVAVLSTPIGWTLADVERVRRCATETGRALVLLAPETSVADFQMAEAAVARQETGPLRHIDWSLWSPPMIPGPLGACAYADRERANPHDEILAREAGRVAALVRLTSARPTDVQCRIIPEGSHSAAPFLEGGEFFLEVRFESGTVARLDVNRRTCLSNASGWMVSGAGGGYRKGRFFQVTRDGEIFDVPQQRCSSEDDFLTRLHRAVRGVWTDRDWLVRAAAVVRAARASAESGQPVTRMV